MDDWFEDVEVFVEDVPFVEVFKGRVEVHTGPTFVVDGRHGCC